MENVSKTLFIPLYGKALVSQRGIILRDLKAEYIWNLRGFPLKGKAKSKWLAYYMAMRSKVFDRWTEEMLRRDPGAVVLHLGCGLDSRCLRVSQPAGAWFDVDFPDVIKQREAFFEESDTYHMIGSDLRQTQWLREIPSGGNCIVDMEGVSMYLRPEEIKVLLSAISGHFAKVSLLVDSYSQFAAKMSKYKNPINAVGVHEVYGQDDPCAWTYETGFSFCREHDMTPEDLIRELPQGEQRLFRRLYAGKFSKGLYRLWEYISS